MGYLGAQIGMGLLDSMYTPQVTQGLHVDAQGNYTDAQGNPADPYVKPGWFSKVISPEARQINSLDAQSQLAPLASQRQADIDYNTKRQIGDRNWNTLTPPQQALFPNEQNAITTTGGDFTGSSLNREGSALADINVGNPALAATTQHNTLSAANLEAQNAATKAALSGLMGTPGSEASAENVAARNATQMGEGQNKLIPQELYNQGYSLGNTALTLQGERAALPAENEDRFNRANVSAGLSRTASDMLPVSQRTEQNELYRGLNNSTYGPISSPLASIMGVDGSEHLGYNPLGVNAHLAEGAGIPGADGMIPTTTNKTLSTGKVIQVPRSVTPSVTALSQQNASGPSTRPTVGQTSVNQDSDNRTTNVADTQKQVLPTVSGGMQQTDTYPMPDNTETWLKNAWDADAPIAKQAGVHTGRAIMNLIRLLQAQPKGQW